MAHQCIGAAGRKLLVLDNKARRIQAKQDADKRDNGTGPEEAFYRGRPVTVNRDEQNTDELTGKLVVAHLANDVRQPSEFGQFAGSISHACSVRVPLRGQNSSSIRWQVSLWWQAISGPSEASASATIAPAVGRQHVTRWACSGVAPKLGEEPGEK